MLVAGAVLFLIIGIKSKMRNNYLRGEKEAIITSPLAEAITELVGISGGIYLALLTMAEFLGLNGEYRILIGGHYLNLLALAALFLAFVQPIMVVLWRKILHR